MRETSEQVDRVPTAHASGPWMVLERDDELSVVQEVEPGLDICTVTPFADDDSGPSYASARLIAAAPEMLVALNQLDNWLVCYAIASPEDMAKNFPAMAKLVEDAIAKATVR